MKKKSGVMITFKLKCHETCCAPNFLALCTRNVTTGVIIYAQCCQLIQRLSRTGSIVEFVVS